MHAKSHTPTFLDAAVKLAIGLIALALLERLALSFPLARDVRAELILPVTDWIKLITATGMIAFLWLFARETAQVLRAANPSVPDFANMMTYLALFVTVAVGYNAYLPLVGEVLPEAVQGYRVVGVVGAVIPLVALVATFFRRLNLIALAVSSGIRRLLTMYPTVKCPGCGEVLPADHNYCPRCGSGLQQREVAQA
ncbi:zinc ribbon domain-containing protein [Symbiobacterium thermophilum]|uniref:Zinc-ribbon domain-containing protein n=1 Tax=Symbiobacterium thermophilum TaxID=2734 RepID=A0A953I3D3_SYMTR|nr:zinc ribbon domain-containing protein [Symbiobacterium thermophilum]MBY6277637.1 hypothetical protein [Symbiobacterium thermophilum]